jgi:hypothetical protein
MVLAEIKEKNSCNFSATVLPAESENIASRMRGQMIKNKTKYTYKIA